MTVSKLIARKRAWAALAGALVLAAIVWFGTPVYGFFAHRGAVPLAPFGWTSLPDEVAPQTQELYDPRFADAGAEAMRRLAAYREQIGAPAMSAAVAVDGELVWAGAVGWADIENVVPASPDTMFRVGSTSKAITATALARLVDRGGIDLDRPINAYLDPLPNPAWASITPRQLAAHTAGLPHYPENTDWLGLYQTLALQRQYGSVRDALGVFDGSRLLFEPGTGFHYSTLGTVLLGAVMGEASNTSYREVISAEIIEPGNLRSTIVAPRGHAENLARFYYRDGERYRRWRSVDLTHRLPGGGWVSTPSDLVRIGVMNLDEGYLSRDVREEFWTPQRMASGEVNPQNYAIGWRWRDYEVDGVGMARNANHGGVSRGSQSWLLVYPELNVVTAFTINTNTDDFSEFGLFYDDLLEAFAGHRRG